MNIAYHASAVARRTSRQLWCAAYLRRWRGEPLAGWTEKYSRSRQTVSDQGGHKRRAIVSASAERPLEIPRQGSNDNLASKADVAAEREAAASRDCSDEHANNVYRAYRDYIVHEDDLVNQRTTWSITIQAFVIAIFGLTYQKKMESIVSFYGLDDKTTNYTLELLNKLVIQFDQFLLIIAIFGLVVASISGAAVYAAQRAIRFVSLKWTSECSGKQVFSQFPSLTGGGNAFSTRLGHVFPLVLPLFLVGFWLFVVLYITVIQKLLLGDNIVPAPL
jgi:hypothetical protein